ncbi:MAG: aminoacyl-tRNA hydrolase [Euryarchaeota archaeon]|nr:aminoacyl-tRNA hydrolase [Euryarchaeota archaeon]
MGLRSFLHRLTAPSPSTSPVDGSVKLVCVVNQSLKMGKGKIAAQVGHASVQAFLGAGVSHPHHVEAWLASGQKKICVKTPETSDFDRLMEEARRADVPVHLVRDAGHTQIPKGSATVLALGPYSEATLDELTGHLKLL